MTKTTPQTDFIRDMITSSTPKPDAGDPKLRPLEEVFGGSDSDSVNLVREGEKPK